MEENIVTNVMGKEVEIVTGTTSATTTVPNTSTTNSTDTTTQTTPITGTAGSQTSTTTTTTVVIPDSYASFARQNQVISWLAYQRFEDLNETVVGGTIREALEPLYKLDKEGSYSNIDSKDQAFIKLFYEDPIYSNWKLVDFEANVDDGFAAVVVGNKTV